MSGTILNRIAATLTLLMVSLLFAAGRASAIDVTVKASDQGMPPGPLSIMPAEELDIWSDYCLIGNDMVIPAQIDMDGRVWWWQVKPMGPGETLTYELTVMGSGVIPVDGGYPINARKRGKEKVTVTANGKPFTTFNLEKDESKPYLYPVIGPTGDPMTRDYPMKDNPIEKQEGGKSRQDHPHHRSIWCAHGVVRTPDLGKKSCNFWGEHDRQVVKRIVRTEGGLVFGRVVAEIDWMAAGGPRLFTEVRTYTFFADKDARIIDVKNVFTFDDSDVRFGDTKEGGILAIRTAVSLDEVGIEKPKKMHGQMVNSQGHKGEQGENGCWGKAAAWCDYFGPVFGEDPAKANTVGIAVLDFPKNFRHPTRWHIRGYGLYTANPFGLSRFTNDKSKDGSHTFKKGETAEFNYRVLLHKGDTKTGRVADHWNLYSKPPKITEKK